LVHSKLIQINFIYRDTHTLTLVINECCKVKADFLN
jgi:hypothetical protein